MRLKSRQHFPPGGFKFYEPAIGENFLKAYEPWRGFTDCVEQIIKIRTANPQLNLATDRATVENELEVYTVSRLASFPGGNNYLVDDGGPEPPSFKGRPPLRNRLAAAAGNARNLVIGASVLKDWLGDGLQPIDRDEAERRASICVRCPNNLPGNVLVDAAAKTFQRLVEAKNEMSLVTVHDDKLETCSACSCRLTLKVWAPLNHILKHTDAGIRSKLWSDCWITEKSAPLRVSH